MATAKKSTTAKSPAAKASPKTKTVTVGDESVEVPTVDAAPKPTAPPEVVDSGSNPAKTDDTDVNASAPIGQVNPIPELDDETATADNTPTAGAVKAAAETYTRVYRIPATERHSKKLPEGFPDEDYARATVREAIQHGWRVEDGVVGQRGKVTFADPAEFNIDVPYTVDVFPAGGAPAGLPVGQTIEETTEEQPNTGDEGVREHN